MVGWKRYKDSNRVHLDFFIKDSQLPNDLELQVAFESYSSGALMSIVPLLFGFDVLLVV